MHLSQIFVSPSIPEVFDDDCYDDEIECLCQQLKDNGKSLGRNRSNCIVSELRTRVIMKNTIPKRARCLCMDLIEYRGHGYSDPGHSTK